MPGIDFGLMALGVFILLVQLVLLIIAFVFGTTSLLRCALPVRPDLNRPSLPLASARQSAAGRCYSSHPASQRETVPLDAVCPARGCGERGHSMADARLAALWHARPDGCRRDHLAHDGRRRVPPAMGPPPRQSLLGES